MSSIDRREFLTSVSAPAHAMLTIHEIVAHAIEPVAKGTWIA